MKGGYGVPEWKWDWKLQQKFITLCKEFGGEMTSFDYSLDTAPFVCRLPGYDDFKSFIQWMDRQTTGFNEKSLTAEYTPPWQDNPHHTDKDYLTAVFTARGVKPKKKLLVTSERVLGVIDEMLRKKKSYMPNGGFILNDFFLTSEDEAEIVEHIQKPYLRQFASVEVDTDNGGCGSSKFIAKSEIAIDLNEGHVLSSVLQDADAAVHEMTKEAIGKFRKNYEEWE